MTATLIVLGTIVFGVAFLVAWLVRRDVRAWLERPKHRFQDHVRRYDRAVNSRR
jgi:hypothetical protein